MNPAVPITKEEVPAKGRSSFNLRILLTVLGPFFGLLLVIGLFSSMPEVHPLLPHGSQLQNHFHPDRHRRHRRVGNDDDHHQWRNRFKRWLCCSPH